MLTRLAVATVLLGLRLSAGAAFAGPPAKPVCENDAQCSEKAAQARKFSQQGLFDEAQRSYEQAYQLQADPKLLYNLARVLHKANRPDGAVTYYQKFLDAGAGGDEEQRRKTTQYIEQARQEAAAAARQSQAQSQAQTQAQTSAHAQEKPLYRKWWLWTAVGAGAALLAVGIGVGVASRQPDISSSYQVSPFNN